MADRAAERARLTGYIVASRRVQRQLATVLAPLGAVGLILAVWQPLWGGLVLLAAVIVAICGFWVTAAHISDWKMQIARLERLDRGARPDRAGEGPTDPRGARLGR
ncbi:MAG: hypothetical protein KBG48_14860 [Kofleriaceae bacterium]|nr:hypothetical protein [Kofleriaceae bacterium]MBP9857452.1 hypothetical protein [Kofleriaceae bacterium]